MVDTATKLREEIYSAIRAFTCATVSESEAATKAVIKIINNGLPYAPSGRKKEDDSTR